MTAPHECGQAAPDAWATVCGISLPLHGTPRAYESSRPGAATVILGYLPDGSPLAVATGSLQYLEELGSASLISRASGIVRGGMTEVTP